MPGPSRSASGRLTILALAIALVAFPLGTLASHDFGDVPNSNPFHADISALANSGVTSGCGGGNYCPSLFVTREQMAAFLNRLGALAPGKTPVVNADRLDGLDSSDFHTANRMRYQVAATVLTPTGMDGGGDPAVGIGLDGNPVIAHSSQGVLKAFSCSVPSCAQGVEYTLDSDAVEDYGREASIAIGADGNPIISYGMQDTSGITDLDLKVYRCSTPTCSAGSDITIDAVGVAGADSSVAIGLDGNPVISYSDNTNSSLKFYACSVPDCSAGTSRTLDNTGDVGSDTSIAIGLNGNPVIAYRDDGGSALRAYACANPTCSSGTIRFLESAGDVGAFTSLAIGLDGNPVISHVDLGPDVLRVFACADPTCASGTGRALDDSSWYSTSIAVGLDGLPVISYYDIVAFDLKLYTCATRDCSKGSAWTLDSAGAVGTVNAMAIGADGSLVIAYLNGSPVFDLKVAVVPADSVGEGG